MTKNNYYEILGVDKDASFNTIKRAYYALSKKYHPDINPKTGNLFRNINEAYATLSNPEKRKTYDNALNFGVEDADISDFNNIFEDVYYENPEYYQDPFKEPLINILADFWKYRFENATEAIWKRNVFVLLGNFFVCLTIFILIVTNRITKKFNGTGINFKPNSNNIWSTYIKDAIKENYLFRYFCWAFFLFTLTTSKFIYHIFKITYWIFAKIIRYFLIPIAILLASLFHVNSFRKRFFY